MPEYQNIEIERAQRAKPRDNNKSTNIVKFTKFKDREAVLGKTLVICLTTSLHFQYTRITHSE